MKYSMRWVMVIGMLLVMGGALYAQDETSAIAVPEDLAGTYIFDVLEAELAPIEDAEGSYTLTLFDTADAITWYNTAPVASGGKVNKQVFISDWNALEDLTTSAILTTENEIMTFTLGAPELGDEETTLVYPAVLESFTPFSGDSRKARVPSQVENATLFITNDTDFMLGLLEGSALREARTITGSQQCQPGYNCPGDPLYVG